MKITSLLGAVVLMVSSVEAQAAITLNESPGGSAVVAFEGLATFSNPAVPFVAVLEDTIIAKTFDLGITDILFDNVEFEVGDPDFAAGFRWTERVQNNSGFAWTSFVLTLSETDGTFFSDLPTFSPSFVTINAGAPILGAGPNTVLKLDTFGTAVRSNVNKTLTFTFATPFASGAFFDIHAPIEGLTLDAFGGGNFELDQSASIAPVPQPASAIVWSLLGLTVGGARWLRRSRIAS